jgi:hypothetical protein
VDQHAAQTVEGERHKRHESICEGRTQSPGNQWGWAEASAPDVGYAIGDRREHRDDPAAEAIYALLEDHIIPEFYQRKAGIPAKWMARI